MSTLVRGNWCDNRHARDFQPKTRKVVRCPDCSRRLLLAEVYCVGGEFDNFVIPPHKTKPYVIKRPKGDRRGTRARRG